MAMLDLVKSSLNVYRFIRKQYKTVITCSHDQGVNREFAAFRDAKGETTVFCSFQILKTSRVYPAK